MGGKHEVVNESYVDADHEVHFTAKKIFTYSEAELALYWSHGSVYNIMNLVACTLYIINPIFDFVGIMVGPTYSRNVPSMLEDAAPNST